MMPPWFWNPPPTWDAAHQAEEFSYGWLWLMVVVLFLLGVWNEWGRRP